MTPFKRLTDAGGQDPWLEATAEKVRAGDPWASISDQRAASVGAAALARVRDERVPRPKPRRLVLVMAALASSLALAAIGRQVVQQWVQEPVVPVRVAPAPKPVPEVVAPLPEPGTVPPSPPVEERPEVREPVRAAKKLPLTPTLPPTRGEGALPATDALDAEAKLLLTALRQLKIERNPEAALATLDEHAARFPEGAMKEEAAAARREAEEAKARITP